MTFQAEGVQGSRPAHGREPYLKRPRFELGLQAPGPTSGAQRLLGVGGYCMESFPGPGQTLSCRPATPEAGGGGRCRCFWSCVWGVQEERGAEGREAGEPGARAGWSTWEPRTRRPARVSGTQTEVAGTHPVPAPPRGLSSSSENRARPPGCLPMGPGGALTAAVGVLSTWLRWGRCSYTRQAEGEGATQTQQGRPRSAPLQGSHVPQHLSSRSGAALPDPADR